MQRLTHPLIRINNHYEPIAFNDAFSMIAENCIATAEKPTLVMANGDYCNEELYLIQKLARAGFKSNAVGSFDYFNRGTAFFIDKNDILPFAELVGSSKLYCILDDTAETLSAKTIQQLIETLGNIPKYIFNTPGNIYIKNYSHFFRAINLFLIQSNLAQGMYVDGLGKNYNEYKEQILKEDIHTLLLSNNLTINDIKSLVADLLQNEMPAFIVWERFMDERSAIELENLCMLLGIQSKQCCGFILIKAELNSQGLFDMGLFPTVCVGGEPFDEDNKLLMSNLYKTNFESEPVDVAALIAQKSFSNCVIFNATGSQIPTEVIEQIRTCQFSVLHTAYFDSACQDFNLVMPATLPEETSGTYTDSARIAHTNNPEKHSPLEYNTLQQLSQVGTRFGWPKQDDPTDIMFEYISFFRGGCRSKLRHFFR